MKKNISILLLLIPVLLFSQEIKLLKGAITDSLIANDSLSETFSIYLPSSFEMSRSWPVIFVFDMEGKGRQALSMFKEAAEEEGYILASSNNISDTLTLSQNVLITNRMFNAVFELIPIQRGRTYTAGFSAGARFASIIPAFVKNIEGVVSCGASIGNIGILNIKNPFYFVGITGRTDYNYPDMIGSRKVLDNNKFPNQLLLFEGGHQWPPKEQIVDAMRILTLSAMTKGIIKKKDSLIVDSYKNSLIRANNLLTNKKPLMADYVLSSMERIYGPLMNLDSLKRSRKLLRKSDSFRTNNKIQKNYFLKESFIRDDYNYYLQEDINTFNYNNLGWWNYQMTELGKIEKSTNPFEKRMGSRLRGYVNALIEDNIDAISSEKLVDEQALIFLYMVKTITEPSNYESYLKIISSSCKAEDYGTALFYLEELLKNGYTNRDELYSLENTGLFRITPEFNELAAKYLKDARYYEIIE